MFLINLRYQVNGMDDDQSENIMSLATTVAKKIQKIPGLYSLKRTISQSCKSQKISKTNTKLLVKVEFN